MYLFLYFFYNYIYLLLAGIKTVTTFQSGLKCCVKHLQLRISLDVSLFTYTQPTKVFILSVVAFLVHFSLSFRKFRHS